jgi:methylisocitrate lyase
MADRVRAAVDGRTDEQFVIVARTDALAGEGLQAALDRAGRYAEAGADVIFAEAVTTLAEYRKFTAALDVPVLANITEFGKTPLFSVAQLREAGVGLVIYPLSAFRAMSAAALKVYETLRRDGTQKSALDTMQTRAALYEVLRYHDYERKLDELFVKGGDGS